MRKKFNTPLTTYGWLVKAVSELNDDPSLPWSDYPCLDWPFSLTKRTSVKVNPQQHHHYGQTWKDGKVLRSSRVAWELVNGPVPPGKLIMHKCDRPICWRPVHLFAGTHKENEADMTAKGRRRSHGPEMPLLRGEGHGRSKLTWENVREIRALGPGRPFLRIIGERYGVGKGTIRRVLKGTHWIES